MANKGCVLVVDDDQTILDAISLALSDEGYETRTAHNGQEALEQLPACKPALILLDMRMPVMDGWEFARQYRQQTADRAPIIVLTAAENATQWAAEANAAGCLAKPFDLDDLLDIVDRYADL